MFIKIKLIILSLSLALLLTACNSRSTGDGDVASTDSIFISDGSSGGITINLSSSSLAVADTAGFTVTVVDAAGAPVPNVRVFCDSENDLAIIEPSSQRFLTSDSGTASGVIGCEDSGSFRFACRIDSGGLTQDIVGVNCTGNRPVGFTGFPGATGGGLGNGVADIGNDTGDVEDDFTVRVTDVQLDETGAANTFQVDIFQNLDCTPDDATTSPVEPFGDSIIKFNVTNNANTTIRFTDYTYSIDDFMGFGTAAKDSASINLIGEAITAKESGLFSGVFLFSGDSSEFAGGSAKFVYGDGSTEILSTYAGFKNVTFTLNGIFANGDPIDPVVVSKGFSFNLVDRCD